MRGKIVPRQSLGINKILQVSIRYGTGSGPGGRRFKSSLPDQSFQTLKLHFWFSVYIDGVEIVDGRVFQEFQ